MLLRSLDWPCRSSENACCRSVSRFFDFRPMGDAMPAGQLSAAVCLVCLAILPERLSAQDSKAPDNKTQDDVLVTQPQLPQGTGERSQGDDAGGSAIGLLPDQAILRQL